MCVTLIKEGATKMSEVTIRRSDIYLAKLLGGENVLRGVHPVLVISCKKFNSCATLVNIVPITSTLKSNTNNIPIGTESGLMHDSELLCGQIQTINQKHLLKKVGFARPQLMDLVIRTIVKNFEGKNNELNVTQKNTLHIMLKSIKKLIGFKVKYNITDVEIDKQIEDSLEEIKSYCNFLNIDHNNWKSLEMFKEYQEKRREIRIARGKKDSLLTAKLSKKYVETLYEMDYETYDGEICKELEWAKYNYSLAIKKLGNIEKSYELSKQALVFSNEEDSNRILIYWLIGECCSLKGDAFKEEGVNAFEKCIEFYKRIGEKKYEILSQFNKSKILRDTLGLKKCIEEYETTQFKNVLHSFGDMENDEVLLELKKEMNSIL
jgi:mRNA-degrading endonuclease toxin of MazEF toxin-antitoxin module